MKFSYIKFLIFLYFKIISEESKAQNNTVDLDDDVIMLSPSKPKIKHHRQILDEHENFAQRENDLKVKLKSLESLEKKLMDKQFFIEQKERAILQKIESVDKLEEELILKQTAIEQKEHQMQQKLDKLKLIQDQYVIELEKAVQRSMGMDGVNVPENKLLREALNTPFSHSKYGSTKNDFLNPSTVSLCNYFV